ncbi:MAG: Z1 domain-containing protein [Actinomycetota bacterium]
MTNDELAELLLMAESSDELWAKFYVKIGQWMSAESLDSRGDETDDTRAQSPERRIRIHRRLGLPESYDADLVSAYPDTAKRAAHVIESDLPWEPWFPRNGQSTFYWDHYAEVLRKKGFGDEAIADLDSATSTIVGRLADPSRAEPYQSKGLVVGYVQSGKTANFAGSIAKAIDAGYKLIIVLTGTIELLRKQTQKRLDKELVGEENVLGGAGRNIDDLKEQLGELDPLRGDFARRAQELSTKIESLKKGVDYVEQDDEDWLKGKFSKFGIMPRQAGVPSIMRVTSYSDDYKGLKSQLAVFDFDRNRSDLRSPIWAEGNIRTGDVWLAVVKKNSPTLSRLRTDLELMQTSLVDIPALIIDDEADQASVNTKKQKDSARPNKDEVERTAINGHIAGILDAMPRSQYLAYTATPYANVFVDPDDAKNIFPKDFIVALEPSKEYMGAKAYHDIDPQTDGEKMSNAEAYYRAVDVDDDGMATDESIRKALDTFVLSGAIKLWRREILGDPGSLKHHTMMVHEGARTAEHEESKLRVEREWQKGDFASPRGMARLRELWDTDFAPVVAERADGAPAPSGFDDFKNFVPRVVQLVNRGSQTDGSPNPVILVNGTKEAEYKQAEINFDSAQGVWKILVGGTKLSRGFTVEGLTVTLYTRVSVAADTLMQMARWFGYRKYYRDLVRLYLGASIQKGRKSVDLYEAFTSIARDEEDFRSELVQYSGIRKDGKPVLTPMDVAPLVSQRLPWLKPTGANKMYNSEIIEDGIGGTVRDLNRLAPRSANTNGGNLAAMRNMLARATQRGTFLQSTGSDLDVAYGVVPAEDVVGLLRDFKFFDSEVYRSKIAFIESRIGQKVGGIDDFVLFVPLYSESSVARLPIEGYPGGDLPILQRKRREPRGDFSGNEPKHRPAAEAIAGLPERIGGRADNSLVQTLRSEGHGRRGVLMTYFAADQTGGSEPGLLTQNYDPNDVATLMSYVLPFESAPKGVIRHSVRSPEHRDQAFIYDA